MPGPLARKPSCILLRVERPITKQPGARVEELDTPALVVDLDAFDANLELVHSFFRGRAAKMRPSVHTHKTPALAHRQLAVDGAAPGVAVVSVAEAEAFAAAGIGDIRIAMQVPSPAKVRRACALARACRVSLIADDLTVVATYSRGASSAGVTLDVLVDVQVHPARAGLQPGAPAIALAKAIEEAPGLRFAGVFTAGGPVGEGDRETLRARDQDAVDRFIAAKREIEAAGLEVPEASYGNSTHDYDIPGATDGVTEVRSGAYPLIDANHAPHCPDLTPAARLLATVNGRPEPGRAVTDCGQKAIGRDLGPPIAWGRPDLTAVAGSAEHGLLDAPDGATLDMAIGDQVWLVPADVSTAFSLHDIAYGIRDDVVEAIWPISARGAFA